GLISGTAVTAGGSTGTLAAKASAPIRSTGVKNDLTFTAVRSGDYWNDFTVSIVDKGGNPEGVQYDQSAKTLRFLITPGTTTAANVKAMLVAHTVASLDFTAAFDKTVELDNDGT